MSRATTLLKLNIMWIEADHSLRRSFRFADFKAAFAFLTDVAAEAERLDHHPWFCNEYNRVEFRLRSHDAGNIVTKRDHKLAAAIDAVAERHAVS
jgi:4a-hydroxytetrahydrobiopterin dehydratase